MELMTYLATQETNTVFTSSGEGGIYSYHIIVLFVSDIVYKYYKWQCLSFLLSGLVDVSEFCEVKQSNHLVIYSKPWPLPHPYHVLTLPVPTPPLWAHLRGNSWSAFFQHTLMLFTRMVVVTGPQVPVLDQRQD